MGKINDRRLQLLKIACFAFFLIVFSSYIALIPIYAYYIAKTTDQQSYYKMTGKVYATKDFAPQLHLKTSDGQLIWVEIPVSEFHQNQRSYLIKSDSVKELLHQNIDISGYKIPRTFSASFRAMTIRADKLVLTNEESISYLNRNRNIYFWLFKLAGFIACSVWLYRFTFKEKS